jgi:hypothetical protein
MPYTTCIKLRIIHHHLHGLKPHTIAKVLEEEGIKVCRFGVHTFLVTYRETGSIESRALGGFLRSPCRLKSWFKNRCKKMMKPLHTNYITYW